MHESSTDLEALNGQRDIRQPHAEFIDTTSREVWQSFDPVSKTWFESVELEPGLARVGYGAGFMDRAWFRRSPGDEHDGPVRTRKIDGIRFFSCAKPVGAGPEGDPPRLMVEKHHSLGFEAGRTIPILESPVGEHFVLVVAPAEGAPPPKLPDGWRLFEIRLEEVWNVDLPNPTETYWLGRFSSSFQGPVSLPSSARPLRRDTGQ